MFASFKWWITYISRGYKWCTPIWCLSYSLYLVITKINNQQSRISEANIVSHNIVNMVSKKVVVSSIVGVLGGLAFIFGVAGFFSGVKVLLLYFLHKDFRLIENKIFYIWRMNKYWFPRYSRKRQRNQMYMSNNLLVNT